MAQWVPAALKKPHLYCNFVKNMFNSLSSMATDVIGSMKSTNANDSPGNEGTTVGEEEPQSAVPVEVATVPDGESDTTSMQVETVPDGESDTTLMQVETAPDGESDDRQ